MGGIYAQKKCMHIYKCMNDHVYKCMTVNANQHRNVGLSIPEGDLTVSI